MSVFASLLGRQKRGAYSGRLAFDSDTGFHVDPDGHPVVSEDGGRTWRYATRGDPGHIARYSREVLTFKGTDMVEEPEPHHYKVLRNDPHYDPEHPGEAKLKSDPDTIAPTVTSHTDAYKDRPDEEEDRG